MPISARNGVNVAARTAEPGAPNPMPWYVGPTVLEMLDTFEPPAPLVAMPLRMPIQDVYRFDQRRLLAGRIESGTLRVGDELVFSPNNKDTACKR